MRKLCRTLLPAYATIVALAMSSLVACSDKVAGGVSEETNTVAGLLAGPEGRPAASVVVYVMDYETNEVAFTDTTDSQGRFGMPVKKAGKYGISGQVDSLAFYGTFVYEGDTLALNAELTETTDITGTLNLRPDSGAVGVTVSIPGSIWSTVSDASGKFTLKGVPSGTMPVAAKSPAKSIYQDAYFMALVKKGSVVFRGPVPIEKFDALVAYFEKRSENANSSAINKEFDVVEAGSSMSGGLEEVVSSSEQAASSSSARGISSASYIVPKSSDGEDPDTDSQPKAGADSLVNEPVLGYSSSESTAIFMPDTDKAGYIAHYGADEGATVVDVFELYDPSVIQLPVSEHYGMVNLWTMEYLARDRFTLYGGAASAPGFDNNAIQFADANQYAVIENDGGVLDGAKALVVEAWINVTSASITSGSLANLVSKPRATGTGLVFALALANNFCSKPGTRLAFGVPEPSETALTCATTAISNKSVELNTWIYVTAVWDGKYISLYQDGNIVSRRAVSSYDIDASATRVTFGGGDANVKLDNVRFGVLPITADDVLYRYYIGGAL